MSSFLLVADHDPFNLRLLQEACQAAGHDVASAASGSEVLAMVARRLPDLLVIDDQITGPDAFEILRILKADPEIEGIPVLLVTTEGDMDSRAMGLRLGAEDYVSRPYRVFEIHHRVRTVLRATRTNRTALGDSLPPANQCDPVTGAGTASQLLISLDYEHTRAERYGHPLTCMVVRVTNAPELAASSADGTADRIMASVGAGLRQCIRAVDYLFRGRRDEFCILLPETDEKGAGFVLRRLLAQIETGELWGGDRGTPRPAIEIAHSSTPDPKIKTGQELLQRTRASLIY